MLVFLVFDKNPNDNLDNKVLEIFSNYENIFYTSSVAICELFHLYKSGDFKTSKYKKPSEVFAAIDNIGIEIKHTTKEHLKLFSELVTYAEHKDPNDHMIIAQAISDRIPIISSDRKFKLYEKQGLQLVFNRR